MAELNARDKAELCWLDTSPCGQPDLTERHK